MGHKFLGCPAYSKALAISAAVFATKRDHSVRQASGSSILKLFSNQLPSLLDTPFLGTNMLAIARGIAIFLHKN